MAEPLSSTAFRDQGIFADGVNGMSITIESPFPLADAPRIFGWLAPFMARVSDDYSPKTMDAFVSWFLAQSEVMKTWGVYRSGELGGVISFQQISPVVGTAHATFKKSFWGHGTTIPAIELALVEMFKNCRKLSIPVFEGNKAMISLLMKIGAKREGLLEGHTVQNGQPANLVLLALFPKPIESKEST
jgi:RimJ/RimL family protein N-acetyltransferase